MTTLRASLILYGFACSTSSMTLQGADWPEFRGPDRRGVWQGENLVENFEGLPDPLPRVWTAPVGAGYSGPTVAGDGVFLMDRGLPGGAGEVERVVCIDRETGKEKWVHSYPCVYRGIDYGYGPRTSVTVHDGTAYALGMMGHLHAIDAASGRVLWTRTLAEDYRIDMPIWGLTSSPLVEGDILVVQVSAPADGACFVGFDAKIGEERWRALADKGSYVSPAVIGQANRRVLVAWSGQRIAGLDPATGKPLWEVPTPPNKMPINVPGPALDETGTRMFLGVFYDGSRLIELGRADATARELWHRQGINERNTDALHCMISPPYIRDGHVYGIDSYGQLRCLDLATGDRIWENLEAIPQGRWGTGFMVPEGGRTWIVTERGEIVIARLTPEGYHEIDRARLIEPTTPLKQRPEGTVLWSYPAFAGSRVYVRNDRELVCVDLGKSR
ncbi:MAG: PQQ-like beta-propeller repeat protein [Verrucomicrobiae bacterium]|nr:PQQ-like beta-propeller repeat protein [Verrucomicrobiae bacterium]